MIGPMHMGSMLTHIGLNPMCLCCCPKDEKPEELGGRQFRDESNPLVAVDFVTDSQYDIIEQVDTKVDDEWQTKKVPVRLLPMATVERLGVTKPVVTRMGIERRLRDIQEELSLEEFLIVLADDEDCCI